MIDIARKLKDEVILNDTVYPLNLAFNQVIKLFEMFSDKEIPDAVKAHIALKMLTGVSFDQLSIEEAMIVFQEIFESHIQITKANKDEVEYDLAGNVMKSSSNQTTQSQKRLYNLSLDGDYVYASFMQAYNIDLIDVQNQLHWKKFNALLNGLPEGTKFVEVLKIRSYKPHKNDSQEYINAMKALQEEYDLPDEE